MPVASPGLEVFRRAWVARACGGADRPGNGPDLATQVEARRVRRARATYRSAPVLGQWSETAMLNPNEPFGRAMTLAALSGLKIALGPAFLTTATRRPE